VLAGDRDTLRDLSESGDDVLLYDVDDCRWTWANFQALTVLQDELLKSYYGAIVSSVGTPAVV
jgi:hypothetical protein